MTKHPSLEDNISNGESNNISGDTYSNTPVNKDDVASDAGGNSDTSSNGSKSKMRDRDALVLLPLDEYVFRFKERYYGEDTFRDLVHKYLGMSGGQLFKLKFQKSWSHKRYMRNTDKLINDYAFKIRTETEKAILDMSADSKEFEEYSKVLHKKTDTIREINNNANNLNSEYNGLMNEKDSARQNAEKELRNKQEFLKAQTERAKQEILIKTNTKAILTDKIKEFLSKSNYVQNDSGTLTWDEEKLSEKLSDVFLNEILLDMDGGTGRFMVNTKDIYQGMISHWENLGSISELGKVDWLRSIQYSRSKGYEVPQYPFLRVGKPDMENIKKAAYASLDTAIAFDVSGSMQGKKFQIERKTVCGTHAMMRRLNPKNNTYLAEFDDELRALTLAELIRKSDANNAGTNTHLALNWLLETLKDSGPSIAMLVTDGAPNNLQYAVDAAKPFKKYDNIMLRLMLIYAPDANPLDVGIVEENIREIGRAAGPRTKVMPIKYTDMSKVMITDISSAISGMYDIDKF